MPALKTDATTKALGAAILLLLSVVGWYIRVLTVEVQGMRDELRVVHVKLNATAMALELRLGGDPFEDMP